MNKKTKNGESEIKMKSFENEAVPRPVPKQKEAKFFANHQQNQQLLQRWQQQQQWQQQWQQWHQHQWQQQQWRQQWQQQHQWPQQQFGFAGGCGGGG